MRMDDDLLSYLIFMYYVSVLYKYTLSSKDNNSLINTDIRYLRVISEVNDFYNNYYNYRKCIFLSICRFRKFQQIDKPIQKEHNACIQYNV